MIRLRRFTALAWLVGPMVLGPMASGQDAKPSPKEISVPVTEGKVTVVEDGGRPADPPPARSRQSARRAADQEREKARAIQAQVRAQVQALNSRQSTTTRQGANSPFRANPDPVVARIGLELAETDEALRAQLDLGENPGVVVVAVTPEGVADRSGIKPNDVVKSLGKAPVRSINQARTKLLGLGKEPLEVGLIRGGRLVHLSLAGPEHGAGFSPELTEFWIGVPITQVDATLRSQLPDLPADAGLVANEVVPESPAAKAGVKKFDILVKLGDKPLKDAEALIAQVQAAGDKPTSLELLRGGKPVSVTITPARRVRGAIVATLPPGPFHVDYNFFVPKPGVAVADPRQQEATASQIRKDVEEIIAARTPGKPLELHLEMLNSKADVENAKAQVAEANARIEASVKELKASMDELKKTIEGLKKPEGK